MRYRKDPDFRPEFHQDHDVREPRKERTSDVEVSGQIEETREDRWGGTNQRQDVLDLGEELQSDSWMLARIPLGSLSYLGDRLRGRGGWRSTLRKPALNLGADVSPRHSDTACHRGPGPSLHFLNPLRIAASLAQRLGLQRRQQLGDEMDPLVRRESKGLLEDSVHRVSHWLILLR
jgi:hypothetical protein